MNIELDATSIGYDFLSKTGSVTFPKDHMQIDAQAIADYFDDATACAVSHIVVRVVDRGEMIRMNRTDRGYWTCE